MALTVNIWSVVSSFTLGGGGGGIILLLGPDPPWHQPGEPFMCLSVDGKQSLHLILFQTIPLPFPNCQ